MITKIREKLAGYKTYFVVAGGVGYTIAFFAGMVDSQTYLGGMGAIGLTGMATIAAKINRYLAMMKKT